MAQHSSRWLNRGAMALLFAGASFVRPVFGASPVTHGIAAVGGHSRAAVFPCNPPDTMHVPLRWARDALLSQVNGPPPLSRRRGEHPGYSDPSRSKAGRALTESEPSFDTPCRLPGTAASAPAARQLASSLPLRVLTLFKGQVDACASHELLDLFSQDYPTSYR